MPLLTIVGSQGVLSDDPSCRTGKTTLLSGIINMANTAHVIIVNSFPASMGFGGLAREETEGCTFLNLKTFSSNDVENILETTQSGGYILIIEDADWLVSAAHKTLLADVAYAVASNRSNFVYVIGDLMSNITKVYEEK